MALGAIVKAGKFFDKKDKNQGKYTVEQKSLPSKNVSKPKNSLVKVLNKSSSGTSFSDGNSEATTRTRRKGGKQTDLVGVAKSIEEKVIKIDSILKDSYAFKRKQSSEEVRRKRSSKLEKAEEDLEKKAPSNFKSKIKLPTGGGKELGILGFIKNFIFWTFIGWMYKKIIPFIPTILKVLSKITQVALFALEIFGGIADVLTKFVAGGIRLVNGLTKTLAVITGARTEQEIEKFTEKLNMVMDLALLAAMLAGDAGFSVLDLFKKKKGRDAAGKVVQKAGGVFRRGLGRAPQRIAAKVAGKKGATIVKGLTTGAKDLGNKATGNIFRRGAGKATQRLAIKLGGKAGGQALAGTSKFLGKAAGPIGTVIGAGFEFAGRKSQGQSNLQAGAGTGASVAGALAGGAAGAKGGAVAGAAIGALFGGVGAVPGAAIGGFIGGIAGAIGGGWLAGKAADKVTGADKVGQPKENTVPGKYRGGIVGKYEKGGIVDSEKPRKKKIQDTVIGKDVGGLPGMSLLFSGGKTSESSSNEDSKESKSESNWWNPFSWGKSEQEDIERGQPTKNAKKPPGLESLEETSKFLKKIPFVGELMGVSVDIAMGQKPDKPVYKSIAEKIIYIGRSMTNVDKVSEISDRSNDIQQFKRGGLSSIQSPFLSPVEKANEELESTLSLIIEKGANDALMDIRERILQEQIKARRQSNQQSNQEPGSTSGPGSRDRDPNARGGYDPRYDQPPSGGGGGTTPSGGGGGGGGVYKPILDLIAKYEAGSGKWESMYPSTKLPGATKMTIAEVARRATGAVGMYQNLPEYLVARARAVGLDPNKDLYNEENQRKIAVYLIERGQAGVTPKMLKDNPDEAMIRLAKVWAAIPVPKDMQGASRRIRRGDSYYAGVGSNKAHITPEMMYQAMGASVKLHETPQRTSQTPTRSPDNSRPSTASTGTPAGRVIPGGSLSFIGHGDGATGKLFLKDASGKNIGSWEAISGVFRTANASQEDRRNVSGTLNPLPDGNYPLLNFAKHSYVDGVGVWSTYINNASGSIGRRSQLLVHNDIGSNGTAGCVGVELGGRSNTSQEKRFLELYQQVQPKSINVAIGKGANRRGGSKPRSSADNSNSKARPAFHGDSGFVNKDNEILQLHKGEFFNVVDKDSVNLFGKDFFETLNNIENKTQLLKVAPYLIGRINSIVHGKSEKITQDSFAINSIFSTNQKLEDDFDNISTKNLEKFNKQQETKTEESDHKGGENENGKKQRVQVTPASHPQTGSGFAIKGVTDGNGRPLILSKGGITAFGEMMQDSKGVVKGSDVASGKRSESHNRKVGGVPNSNHLFGNALDIHGSSQTWMRQKGRKYGWVINDYPGSHGGHFDYKGKDSTGGGGDPTGQDSGSSSSGSGGGGGSTGGGGGSMGGGSGGSSGGGMSSPRDRDPSARGGYDPRYDRKEQEIEATPTQPLIPGGKLKPGSGSGGGFTGDELNAMSNEQKWKAVMLMAQKAGAKYPELVAAQFALESGWGKKLAAKNNYFGIKADDGEDATISNTREEVGGKSEYIDAPFKNFNSPQDAVNHLVTQWYKDFKNYKGVNNAESAAEAAAMLRAQGYATDSGYAKHLQRLLKEHGNVTITKDDISAFNKKQESQKDKNKNKDGKVVGDPGDVEQDQQIAGHSGGKYGQISSGFGDTDGQDTGTDIEIFGTRGKIGKQFGNNATQGPYGNRGVEISFPYELTYYERVPGGRNAGAKSIDKQGSTNRVVKGTGQGGFGHIGSYVFTDENGKRYEIMMGHGNKPFKKFKEGEKIPPGTVVGWQGASGSSDDGAGGLYDHITFHVNAIDKGGDPDRVIKQFANSLVTGQGAKLTAKQREEQKKEAEIAKNRPKGSESVIAGKPVVWDGKDWKPKPKDTSLLATTANLLGKVGNSLMNAIIPGASAAQKPATKPATKPERSWYDPRGWIGKEGGGLIGKPNVKTSAINNVSQFSSYEEPGGGNIVMIQEIEVIKYVTKNKPSSPFVSGGGEKKTSDKSYMLRRQ